MVRIYSGEVFSTANMMDADVFDGTIKTADEAKKLCVAANRILALEKVLDAFGHVSVRNPENPETFFISWATSPEFVTIDDILECDLDGTVLTKSTRRAYGERIIHASIMRRRPDVNAVCHAHPATLFPFVCGDIPFQAVTPGCAIFHEGVPMLTQWDPESGLHISTASAGESLAKTLGQKRAALIRSHGMVVTGDYTQQMVLSSIALMEGADILWKVLAIGAAPRPLGADEAKNAAAVGLGAISVERAWNYRVVKLKEAFPDLCDLGI